MKLDPKSHVCPVCKNVLRDAVQTACGHHMCAECVDTLFAGTTGAVRCPANEEDCEDLLKTGVITYL